MSSSTTELHKVWIDQCAATEDIRDHFGLSNALDYLIGEKLFSFLRAAEQDPLFAAELPDFIREIQRFFTAEVIRDYLDRMERTKYLAPPLCANMSETSRASTITVGRGKKCHFDEHKHDKHFFRCVGSFGA